jgi:hypothetical protein
METLFGVGSILKGERPYTDDEKRLLKDIFFILDNEEDTEENVAKLRLLLTHLNLSFTNKDIQIAYFFNYDGGINIYFSQIFRKFMNKLNFLYAILDREINMYKRIAENDIEQLRHFARFVHNIDYNRDRPLLQYLFEHGISPDISIVRTDGIISHTLLHMSVENDTSTEETEFLLHYGADPNNHNRDTTPTEYAIFEYEQEPNNPINAERVRLLLEYEGDYTGHENNPIVQEFLAINDELKRLGNLHVGDNLDAVIASYQRKDARMEFEKNEECIIS